MRREEDLKKIARTDECIEGYSTANLNSFSLLQAIDRDEMEGEWKRECVMEGNIIQIL